MPPLHPPPQSSTVPLQVIGRKYDFCIWAIIIGRGAVNAEYPPFARAIMTVQSNVTSIVTPVASATVEVLDRWTKVCLNDVTIPRTSRYFFAMRFLDVAEYYLDDITVTYSTGYPTP